MKKLKQLYFYLPVWAQNAGISAYAFYRNKLFRENKYYNEGKDLVKKINRWDQEEIEEWQLKKLNEITNYAIQNTSFYKDFFGVDKVKFDGIGDFKELPTIDKNTVRSNWEKLQVDHEKPVFKTKTSGTTGSSLRLRISAKNTAYERAGINYYRNLAGYKSGDKIASFIGRKVTEVDRSTPPFWRRNYFDNQLIFSYWHVSDANLPLYVKKYNSFEPDYVHGYPSFIYLFAEYALRNNMQIHKPQAVFTGSETLLSQQREVIETAFNSKILDRYGTAEQLLAAHQCNYGGYHVREELGYLETIEGETYGTTFHNLAMPLIRYKIGDIAEIDITNCRCGINGRNLKTLFGRKEDIIVSKNGKKYGRLDHLFKETSSVKEAQLVQLSLNTLQVNIVPSNESNFSIDNVKQVIYQKLGDEFNINYKILDSIPRGNNGKFRFVKSKVSHE